MGPDGCDMEEEGTTENTEFHGRLDNECSCIVHVTNLRYTSRMDGSDDQLLHRAETFRIRGAAYDVYRAMGSGFLEPVYQECLGLELAKQEVPFEGQKPLSLQYRGEPLRQSYVVDFVCFGRSIVAIKAVRAIAPEHRAQTINYMRASGLRVGLLVNFGAFPGVEIERFAL